MKLSDQQKSEIDRYISTFNIEYYELKQEFLDHMICSVEAILEQKQITLKEAILEAKLEFEPLGFRGIMEERQIELRKQYRKEHWNSVKKNLNFPQIVGTFVLFLICYIVLAWFSNVLIVGGIVYIVGFILVIIENLKLLNYRKKEKQKLLRVETFLSEKLFLAMMMPQMFFNGVNFFKDSIDYNHFVLRIAVAIILVYTILSILIFRKVARKEIKIVKLLYFT